MRSRYLTNVTIALLAGFLVVTSMAFAVPVFMWLMLGVGIAALVIAGPGVTISQRGYLQRSLDGVAGLLGAWTIIASMVFAGAAVTWLGFASGIGLVAIAVVALTAHELSTEHVVHSLAPSVAVGNGELAGTRAH